MASRLSRLCAVVWLSFASLSGCGGEAVTGGDTQNPAPDAGTKEGGGKADQADCPADLMNAEGNPCSSPSAVCGKCPEDPCKFCSLLGCMGGTWTWLEASPDPSCSQDGGTPGAGPVCGALNCKQGQYCYHTGCGVDGCTPPEPECFDLPPGCTSCDCAKPFPSCTCTKVDGGFSIDCPAA